MADFPFIITKFDGGISFNSKSGLPDGYRFSRNLAPFYDTDQITLNPKPIKDSGSVVTDLVKWISDANPYQNVRYATGDSGNIYKIDSNTWSVDRLGTDITSNESSIYVNPTGQGLGVLKNSLYYATATTLGMKNNLNGSPSASSYDDDFLDGGSNLDSTHAGTTNSYTPPVAISEVAVDKQTFTPFYEPILYMNLNVKTKGTGDWTITLHDSNNNLVGTATRLNASLSNSSISDFSFTLDSQNNGPRIIQGNTYHFHVTSTVADGTLGTTTSSSMADCYFQEFFQILLADDNYHPIINHTNGVTGIIVIGNGEYMATWDGTTYNPNKIHIEPGYSIRGWTRDNEYIVAYCWKGTSIDGFETGKMFYWNGIDPYYNYSVPVEGGMPNAAINNKNRIFSILGSGGDLNLGNDPFRMIQDAPKITTGYRVEVMPGAITNWQRRVFFGYSNTNDPNTGNYDYSTGVAPLGLEQGVYEFGNQSDRAITYTDVSTEGLNFAFSPSTSIANPSSFKIGCLEAFGKDMYISYKDGSTYYVDRVSKTNSPCANGSWESLIIDQAFLGKNLAQMPQKTKAAVKLIVTCPPLPANCSITPKYRLNRAANWTLGTALTTTGAVRAELLIMSKRYREIEIGWDFACSGSGFPYVTSIGLFADLLSQEADES